MCCAGELSIASVKAAASNATDKGFEHSRAAPPAVRFWQVTEEAGASATPSPERGATEAAANAPAPDPAAVAGPSRPEDDLWSHDADEDADEADREDARAAAETALLDAAAEQAALECAAEEAAAAAASEEEAFLLPCERVRCLIIHCSSADSCMHAGRRAKHRCCVSFVTARFPNTVNLLISMVDTLAAGSRTGIGFLRWVL